MKFTPLEWSPHVCTQPFKEINDDGDEKSDDHAEVVSLESASSSSSPIRRRESTGSFSHSSSSSGSEDTASFLDDPSICFRALSLQPKEEATSPPPVVEASPRSMVPTKRRIVKAIRVQRDQPPRQEQQHAPPPPQDVSPLSVSSDCLDACHTASTLDLRKESFLSSIDRSCIPLMISGDIHTSTSSLESLSQPANSPAKNSPSLPPAVPHFTSQVSPQLARPTLSRSKRQRGGSDVAMAMGETPVEHAPDSDGRRKKRRLNRNRAMTAQEFESVLSQLDIPASL